MLNNLWRAWKEQGEPLVSLGSFIFTCVSGLVSAGVIAWTARAWGWYWSTFSWFGVAIVFLLAFFVLALAFFLIATGLSRWRSRHTAKPQVREGLIDRDQSFFFLAPPNYEGWKARIRFNRSGDRLKIRLDYSAHSGGVGKGYWSARTQRLFRDFSSFAKGQDVTFDVMTLDDGKPKRFWHWSVEEQPLVSQTMNLCRLAFIVDDHVMDDFNFVVFPSEGTDFVVVDDHHFNFAAKWRRDDGT